MTLELTIGASHDGDRLDCLAKAMIHCEVRF